MAMRNFFNLFKGASEDKKVEKKLQDLKVILTTGDDIKYPKPVQLSLDIIETYMKNRKPKVSNQMDDIKYLAALSIAEILEAKTIHLNDKELPATNKNRIEAIQDILREYKGEGSTYVPDPLHYNHNFAKSVDLILKILEKPELANTNYITADQTAPTSRINKNY